MVMKVVRVVVVVMNRLMVVARTAVAGHSTHSHTLLKGRQSEVRGAGC